MQDTVQAELDRIEVQRVQAQPLPDGSTALSLLREVYRDRNQPLSARMRAAIEALPHENPRLSAVAVGYMTGDTFAERLERCIARSNRAKLIEGRVIGEA